MTYYTTILIVTSVLCVICLIIEATLNESLQSNSGHYINKLQEHNTSSSENFFLAISSGAEYLAMGIGFILYVPTQSKIGSLCVAITFISTWIGDVLKILYAHPRPFWVYSDVSGMSCANDFGAPSGHAVVVGAIIIYFYVLCFSKFRILSTVVAAMLLGLIALDRNYLGVHFYFQVVQGYAIAGLIVCICMSNTAGKLLEQCNNRILVICLVELVIFLASLLAVLIYFVRDPYFDSDWSRNYKSECHGTLNRDAAMFKSLLESTAIWLVGGFALGIYLFRKHSQRSWKYYIASYLLFIVIVIVEQIIEMFSRSLSYTSQYFIFSIARFLLAFCIAFLAPFLLSLCFAERKVSYLEEKEIPISNVEQHSSLVVSSELI